MFCYDVLSNEGDCSPRSYIKVKKSENLAWMVVNGC